jgi:hypothetical protein
VIIKRIRKNVCEINHFWGEKIMSDQTLRIIVPLALILHGIGHWMGLLTAAGVIKTDSWNARSWLLTDLLGDTTTRILALAIWAIVCVGFLAAGAGAWGWSVTAGSWRTIAVVCAVLSLVGLFFFWNAFASLFPNKIGAIAINVIALVGILIADWPSTDVIS